MPVWTNPSERTGTAPSRVRSAPTPDPTRAGLRTGPDPGASPEYQPNETVKPTQTSRQHPTSSTSMSETHHAPQARPDGSGPRAAPSGGPVDTTGAAAYRRREPGVNAMKFGIRCCSPGRYVDPGRAVELVRAAVRKASIRPGP